MTDHAKAREHYVAVLAEADEAEAYGLRCSWAATAEAELARLRHKVAIVEQACRTHDSLDPLVLLAAMSEADRP